MPELKKYTVSKTLEVEVRAGSAEQALEEADQIFNFKDLHSRIEIVDLNVHRSY